MTGANARRGRFITLEGTEGVGKTTNLEFIRDWLVRHRIPCHVTREPGGTPLAEQVRDLLLENRDEVVDSYAELLLVFAARAQHLNALIRPALNAGEWVLCDRFTDATYAYQGGGRQLSLSAIELLENMVQGDLRPDLTIVLDIDVATGLDRAGNRAVLDRFERQEIAFFERVRATYRRRAEAAPGRYRIVDAGKPLAAVQADIAATLETIVGDWQSY